MLFEFDFALRIPEGMEFANIRPKKLPFPCIALGLIKVVKICGRGNLGEVELSFASESTFISEMKSLLLEIFSACILTGFFMPSHTQAKLFQRRLQATAPSPSSQVSEVPHCTASCMMHLVLIFDPGINLPYITCRYGTQLAILLAN